MTVEPALPEVEGLLTADEARATAEAIAEWQLPSGMIPWFPGGHADAWNHVEAAMALDIGGKKSRQEGHAPERKSQRGDRRSSSAARRHAAPRAFKLPGGYRWGPQDRDE